MNTLRLENINLHAPYRVMQDPERHNNFYFVSDSGARFDIDFAENDSPPPPPAPRGILMASTMHSDRHAVFVTGYSFAGSTSTSIVTNSSSRLQKAKWTGR